MLCRALARSFAVILSRIYARQSRLIEETVDQSSTAGRDVLLIYDQMDIALGDAGFPPDNSLPLSLLLSLFFLAISER